MEKKSAALADDQEPRLQVAALPYRFRKTFEIMLVSSLDSGRWIVPKGWPMKGRTSQESAAREAFEEAGLKGEIGADAIGHYHYFKRRKNGSLWHCRVEIFAMKVKEQRRIWPEKSRRKTKWFPVEKAAMLVAERELSDLILNAPALLGEKNAGAMAG